MEQDEPLALYDFLYKDRVICNSLYSQIFKGLLTSSRSSTQSDAGVEKSSKANVKIVGLERTKTDFSRMRLEESLDPHDIIILETIAKIAPSAKRISSPDLQRGDIVVATGKLHIFNRPQVEASLDAFEQAVTVIPRGTPHKQSKRDELREMKAGLDLMRRMMISSSCLSRGTMFP